MLGGWAGPSRAGTGGPSVTRFLLVGQGLRQQRSQGEGETLPGVGGPSTVFWEGVFSKAPWIASAWAGPEGVSGGAGSPPIHGSLHRLSRQTPSRADQTALRAGHPVRGELAEGKGSHGVGVPGLGRQAGWQGRLSRTVSGIGPGRSERPCRKRGSSSIPVGGMAGTEARQGHAWQSGRVRTTRRPVWPGRVSRGRAGGAGGPEALGDK